MININVFSCFLLPVISQEIFYSYGYHYGEESYESFVKNLKNYYTWYQEEFNKIPTNEAKALWEN